MDKEISSLTKLFEKLDINSSNLSTDIDIVQKMFNQMKLDSTDDEIDSLIDGIDSLHITSQTNDVANMVTIKLKNNTIIYYTISGCGIDYKYGNHFTPHWGQAF